MDSSLKALTLCVVVVASIAGLASASTRGYVTGFSVNGMPNGTEVLIDAGSTLTFRCNVSYNTSAENVPLSYFKKLSPTSQHFETLATMEEMTEDVNFMGRETGRIVDKIPGFRQYEYVLTNAVAGDSANYSCSTNADSDAFLSVNISVEPTEVKFYVDDVLLPNYTSSNIYKKTLPLDKPYSLRCSADGGNPFPQMELMAGDDKLPVTRESTDSDGTDQPFPGTLRRNRTINAVFTMSKRYIGAVISCSVGARAPNVTSVQFRAIADNAVPQFNCSDTFYYDRENATFAISCRLYAANLTKYHVEYKGPGSEMGIVNSTTGTNARFSFQFQQAQGDDVWSTMTLDVKDPQNFANLTSVHFIFFARNSNGQNSHTVTVQYKTVTSGTEKTVMSLLLSLAILLISSVIISQH